MFAWILYLGVLRVQTIAGPESGSDQNTRIRIRNPDLNTSPPVGLVKEDIPLEYDEIQICYRG